MLLANDVCSAAMLDAALGTSTARVRSARIAKDLARALPQPQVYYVTAPLGPPRLWSAVALAAVTGFESALHDGPSPGATTLRHAIGASARSLARFQGTLIEPNLSIDAQIVCLLRTGDQVHIVLSSGMRIYRSRDGEPQRLLGKAQRSPGISHGGLQGGTEQLQPGDLYVLGSRDAFGMRSLGAVAAALARDRNTPVSELCDAALGPCRADGLGAALAIVRVP